MKANHKHMTSMSHVEKQLAHWGIDNTTYFQAIWHKHTFTIKRH